MKRPALFLLLLCTLSCSDRYDWLGMLASQSPDADRRFAESMESNAATGLRHQRTEQDQYRLFVGSDLHIIDGTAALDRFVGDYLDAPSAAPFLLILGDFVQKRNRFDLVGEHLAPIATAGRTLFTTVGNHDLHFGQWREYRNLFHSSTYWFEATTPTAGKDLYICLDSGGGTLGKDQRDWLEKLLREKQGAYRHILVFTHTHFFNQGDTPAHARPFNLEEGFDLAYLFARYGVDYVFSGHDHHRNDVSFKDVRYFVTDALSEEEDYSGYAVFTIGDKIEATFVQVR